MAQFSAADAALTGFRVVSAHPKAVAAWAGFMVVFSLAYTAFLVLTAGDAFTELYRLSQQPPSQDPSAMLSLMGRLGPAMLPLALISLGFYVVLFSAMNRVVLRPEDDRFAYLRVGRTELALLGTLLLFILVMIGVEFVSILAAIIVGVLGGLIAPQLAGLFTALGLVAVFLVMGYVAVRLSLALPLTFDLGRVRLFQSWALTRDRFWPMLGCYVLVFFLSLAAGLLGFIVYFAIGAVAGGGPAAFTAAMRDPNMGSLAAALSPLKIVLLALGAIWNALLLPLWATPPAAIYRAIVAEAPEAAF